MSISFDPDDQIHQIQILLASLPVVLEELVAQLIQQQPDMQLVGHVQGEVELLLAVRHDLDVLILGAPTAQPLPGICTHLLGEYPGLKIVVITASGDLAVLYWLGLRHHQLRTVSLATLPGSIRHAYTLNPTERARR
jgi:hypothetical protein